LAGEGDVAKYMSKSAPSSSAYPFGFDCVGVLRRGFVISGFDNVGVVWLRGVDFLGVPEVKSNEGFSESSESVDSLVAVEEVAVAMDADEPVALDDPIAIEGIAKGLVGLSLVDFSVFLDKSSLISSKIIILGESFRLFVGESSSGKSIFFNGDDDK
jgi:hypothetical protein